MKMLDWDKLRIFHTAAESGSFTHAAEKLGMSQSAVSRQISALEDDLGPLFRMHEVELQAARLRGGIGGGCKEQRQGETGRCGGRSRGWTTALAAPTA